MIGLGLSARNASFLTSAQAEVIEQLLLENYSGAVAAYSLRKISGAYTGSAVRVRRESDQTEQDIGFDSEGSLDTAALTTFCSGTNGFVTTWYDQANSNDATQATTTSQPKIYDSSTGVLMQNGKPTLQTDGTNDFLQSASNYTPTDSMAICIVAKGSSSETDQVLGDSNDRRHGMGLRIQNSNFNYFNGTTTGFDALTRPANNDQNVHFFGRTTASNFYARLNESETTSTITAADTTAMPVYIASRSGGSLPLLGDIQELIIWTVDQSSNKENIEDNVGAYYTTNSPLIDTYTGPVAAYSLRKLSDSYSGSAIRVRRDGDNLEQDIGFNLFEGLDTQALIDFCGSNDGFVTTWYDQSSNSVHSYQTTTTAQPKIYDGATTSVVTDEGKPAIDFTSSIRYLRSTSTVSVTGDQSFLFVGSLLNDGLNHWMWSSNTGSNANPGVKNQNAGRSLYWVDENNALAYLGAAPEPLRYLLVATADTDAPGTNSFISSADAVTDNQRIKNIDNHVLTLGASPTSAESWNGKMQEFILYDEDLTTSRTGLETNVNDFYTVWQTLNFDLTPVDIAFVGGQTEWSIVITGEFSRASSATDAQRYTANMAGDARNTYGAYNRLNLKATVDIVDPSTQTTHTATGYFYTSAPETADGVISFRLSGQDASSLTFADLNLTATDFTPNLPDLTPAGQISTGWEGRVTLEADPASPVTINGSTYNASSNNDWDSQPSGAYQSFFVLTS